MIQICRELCDALFLVKQSEVTLRLNEHLLTAMFGFSSCLLGATSKVSIDVLRQVTLMQLDAYISFASRNIYQFGCAFHVVLRVQNSSLLFCLSQHRTVLTLNNLKYCWRYNYWSKNIADLNFQIAFYSILKQRCVLLENQAKYKSNDT